MRVIRKFLNLWLLAFLFSLSICQFGCKDAFRFQDTNDPSIDIRNNDNCKLYLVGQVIDAQTLEPIYNAFVRLGDEVAATDISGMYRIEVTDPLELTEPIRTMSVRKTDYEIDTYQFRPSDWLDPAYCEGALSFVCLDFVMTPMKDPVIIQPDVDSKFQFRDTSVFLTDQFGEGLQVDTLISVLDLFIPAGAVDQPTPMWLTTYARSSYAGAVIPGTSINLPIVRFRISTNPMIDLKLPFVVSFTSDHPVPYSPADPLDLFRYNSLIVPYKYYDLNTNIWKKVPDAIVGFHQPSQMIQVRSKVLGSYLVTNDAYWMTLNEQFSLVDEMSYVSLSNCECGEAQYFNYNVIFDGNFKYGLKDQNMFPIFDQVIYMNDWKVMTNTPSSSLVRLKTGPGTDQFNQFLPGPDKVMEDYTLLQKCEQLYVTYRNINQQATGQQYGTQYGFQRPIGVQYYFNSFPCPTTSACHQGCPK